MSNGGPGALLKVIVPRLPFIIKTAAFHSIGYSETSSVWDLKTEMTIRVLRDILTNSKPTSITQQQKIANKATEAKGNVWVSAVTLPVPEEDDMRQLLFTVIEEMKKNDEEYNKDCVTAPLYAEWNGYRADAGKDTPLPADMSEGDRYKALLKENTGKTVLLYFHGGAYFLLDPAWYRPFTSKLSKMFHGRVFNVRYRLAPQNAFPGALLDALHAYLSLLYPPQGSPHEPVKADDIVFGGDSAGGNLASVLLTFLVYLHQRGDGKLPTVKFNGKEVEVPLPAGAALLSPWLDHTRGLPSIFDHAKYDYLPVPLPDGSLRGPKCEAWPVNPARATLYAEGSALLHPLLCPLTMQSWRGCPPIFILCGEEMLADEDKLLAQITARQGVKVVWEYYEKMPHVFPFMLPDIGESKMALDKYAEFVQVVTQDPLSVQSKGTSVSPRKLERTDVDVTNLRTMSDEEMLRILYERQQRILKGLEDKQQNAVPML